MDRKPRRLGMGDLMILIAALGVGMWSARNLWRGLTDGPPWQSYWLVTPGGLVVAAFLTALAAPMTLACLALRLRQPRPAWRRIWVQPGAAACLACALMFALRALETVVIGPFLATTIGLATAERAYRIRVSDSSLIVFVAMRDENGVIGSAEVGGGLVVIAASFVYPTGYAVAAVWLVQAVSGRWRPEKSWIDRLGRLLGMVWIVVMVLTALHA